MERNKYKKSKHEPLKQMFMKFIKKRVITTNRKNPSYPAIPKSEPNS